VRVRRDHPYDGMRRGHGHDPVGDVLRMDPGVSNGAFGMTLLLI